MCELLLTIGCVIIIFLVFFTLKLEGHVKDLQATVERFERGQGPEGKLVRKSDEGGGE